MLLCFLRRLYSVSARLLALVPLTRVALMMPPSDTDAVPAAPRAPKEGAVGPSIRRRLDSLRSHTADMMPPSYTDAVPAASLLERGTGGLRLNQVGFVSGRIEGT